MTALAWSALAVYCLVRLLGLSIKALWAERELLRDSYRCWRQDPVAWRAAVAEVRAEDRALTPDERAFEGCLVGPAAVIEVRYGRQPGASVGDRSARLLAAIDSRNDASMQANNAATAQAAVRVWQDTLNRHLLDTDGFGSCTACGSFCCPDGSAALDALNAACERYGIAP